MGKAKIALQKIRVKLQRLNRISFVLVITSILFILAFTFRIAFRSILEKNIVWFETPFQGECLPVIVLFAVVFGPLLETYINQVLPYLLLSKIKYLNARKYLIIIISALFFGILHFYSLFYIIYAFFLGLALMYGYMIRIEVDKRTFYLIAISHSIFNLGVLIFNL
jgi:hypothetical protein